MRKISESLSTVSKISEILLDIWTISGVFSKYVWEKVCFLDVFENQLKIAEQQQCSSFLHSRQLGAENHILNENQLKTLKIAAKLLDFLTFLIAGSWRS